MGKIRERIVRFMHGRYGVDQLYYAMLILCFVQMLISSFINLPIFNIVVWVTLILAIYRTLSRNIYKRQLENHRFLRLWKSVESKFSLAFVRIKEIKTNRYRKCPHCTARLRLPIRKGRHMVSCPRCHRDFKVHIVI